jgi:hypothetical protein
MDRFAGAGLLLGAFYADVVQSAFGHPPFWISQFPLVACLVGAVMARVVFGDAVFRRNRLGALRAEMA